MAACKTVFSRLTSYLNSPIILQTRNILPICQQHATFRTKDYEKFGIPPPPKRPLGAFFRFREMTYPKLKAENPDRVPKELLKLIAEEWAKCPPEKKLELKEQADADYNIFKQDFENYKKSLSSEDILRLNKAKETIAKQNQRADRKEKAEDLDRPKRPISAYNLYFRDKMHTTDALHYKAGMKKLANAWKVEAYEVKKKYREEYERLKAEYKIATAEWEKKMIQLGHLDVIGTRTLRKLYKEYKEKKKTKGKKTTEEEEVTN